MADTTTQGATAREQFEAWWEREGQFCRAGGGNYEKTFAFQAWKASRAQASAPQEPSDARFLGHIRDDGVFSRSPVERRPGDVWTEAWSAPQPPAALSPERVREIVVEAGYDLDTPDPERAAFISGVRHGEAAHGITGAPDA